MCLRQTYWLVITITVLNFLTSSYFLPEITNLHPTTSSSIQQIKQQSQKNTKSLLPLKHPQPTSAGTSATATKRKTTITYHTVEPGDTLEAIATKYNLTWLQLANYNKLSNPNLLQVDQIIKISNNPNDYEDLSPYYQAEIYQAKEDEKHILVVLSEQKLYIYEGEVLIADFLISSGVAKYPTVTGIFKVWIKLESTTMSGGTGKDSYNLPNVPYTMYFFGDYAIHGTYWHNNFGTPMSHGCINMRTEDAQEIFNWSTIGTIVQVVP